MSPGSSSSLDGSPRPISVLGGSGMLGRAVCDALAEAGLAHWAPPRSACDVSNPASVRGSRVGASAVCFNCAAWTDVDGAESHEAEALAINGGEGLAALCDEIRSHGSLLVHVSTDYVFDGGDSRGAEAPASTPYAIDHPLSPINAYGRTKAKGEAVIRASGCRYLIVRTSWLYAPWGKNFVRTIAGLAAQRTTLRVVSDQRGRPTSAQHLARCLLGLAGARVEGTFHATDGGECTWYEFAAEIVRQRGAACEVRPCTTEEFPRPAARPRWSVLDLMATERVLGPMPHWKENLATVLARLEPL